MYQKIQSFPLKYSASALNNNLSCFFESSEKYHIAIIHKSLVNFITYNQSQGISARQITCKSISGSASSYQPSILQAKWVTVDSKTVFIIVSQRGIQVFESNGLVLLYWHSFFSPDVESVEETYGQGIAAVGNLICVGSSDGHLLVFHITTDNGEITNFIKIEGHQASVSYLWGNNEILVSADDSGSILLWKEEDDLKKKHFFPGKISACTSLGMWRQLLIASFSNGQLKIFDTNYGILICDVDAHARSITSIDIAQECGLVLSASEDSYVRVWQLKLDSTPVISLKFSKNILDCPLNGAQFIGTSGNKFCVTGYDLNEVICFEM